MGPPSSIKVNSIHMCVKSNLVTMSYNYYLFAVQTDAHPMNVKLEIMGNNSSTGYAYDLCALMEPRQLIDRRQNTDFC